MTLPKDIAQAWRFIRRQARTGKLSHDGITVWYQTEKITSYQQFKKAVETLGGEEWTSHEISFDAPKGYKRRPPRVIEAQFYIPDPFQPNTPAYFIMKDKTV